MSLQFPPLSSGCAPLSWQCFLLGGARYFDLLWTFNSSSVAYTEILQDRGGSAKVAHKISYKSGLHYVDPVQKFFKNCLGDSRQKRKLCPNYCCSFCLYWVYFHYKISKIRQIPWIVSKTGVIQVRFSISTREKKSYQNKQQKSLLSKYKTKY